MKQTEEVRPSIFTDRNGKRDVYIIVHGTYSELVRTYPKKGIINPNKNPHIILEMYESETGRPLRSN